MVEDQIFRVLSHNVNGISSSTDSCDVQNFAISIADKSVSLFGLQELNRNFERTYLRESFHYGIRGVSTHHHGAVSSAKLDWPRNYQPGNRKSWLESLCEAKAEAGEGDKETVFRNLIRIEQQRRNARIIGRVNEKLKSGSVTSVVAPNESGEWVEVVGKEEIERALLQENERRFNQAKSTPFLQQPLLNLVGKLGVGRVATIF